MKFVLASYGTRGDIEPAVAIGCELQRRGHEVHMAVPPDLVGFVEAAGLEAIAYGLETKAWLDAYRNFWTSVFRNVWRIGELRRLWPELWQPLSQCWEEINSTLTSVADGADLLFTGLSFEQPAANVAEYLDVPLATLHYLPVRANSHVLPFPPGLLGRAVMSAYDWLGWLMDRKLEAAQRRELGLPKATVPVSRRIAERGSLEIQAYDEDCFPGLAAEWARGIGQRPFVGALTMELATNVDDEVATWIAAGQPPIFFGFGSMPVESPADTLAMITAACAELGERPLVCAGWTDFGEISHGGDVKVVSAVNFAAVFARCRAVVHHGGAGTTAIGLRAGVPTVILSMDVNQTLWGAAVKRLKIGTARRFSSTTRKTLVEDLRTVLTPDYAARAREFAPRMTKPSESVAAAADLLEVKARLERVR